MVTEYKSVVVWCDMNVSLKFHEKDFTDFRSFEASVKRQLGPTVYVGTDSLTFWFRYPKALVERLRPSCPNNQLEFELTSENPEKK